VENGLSRKAQGKRRECRCGGKPFNALEPSRPGILCIIGATTNRASLNASSFSPHPKFQPPGSRLASLLVVPCAVRSKESSWNSQSSAPLVLARAPQQDNRTWATQ